MCEISQQEAEVLVKLLSKPYKPNQATLEARKLWKSIPRIEYPTNKTMKETFKFIIRAERAFGFQQTEDGAVAALLSYNPLANFGEYVPEKIVFEKGDDAEMLECLANMIASDYVGARLANTENFVFGDSFISDSPRIFANEDVSESFYNMVTRTLIEFFNDDFFKNFDGEKRKILFELEFEITESEVVRTGLKTSDRSDG